MTDFEVKTIDLDDRCAEPAEDDVKVERIECNFAIPVFITQEQQGRLHALMDEIAESPKNTPKEGVHWFSFNGAKLNFSAIDSALLRQPVGSNPPPNGEEPEVDETVLCFGTSARSFNSEREKARELRRRAKT